MTEDSQQHPSANRMLGSQFVTKSLIRNSPTQPPTQSTSCKQQAAFNSKNQQHSKLASTTTTTATPTTTKTDSNDVAHSKPSAPVKVGAACKDANTNRHLRTPTTSSSPPSKHQEQPNTSPTQIPMSKKSLDLKNTKIITATIDDGTIQQKQASVVPDASSSAKELQLLAKEAQDLKSKSRKLQLEVDEKNEIINVLKDELETLREQNDKYHRDSIQLIKDSKRVKFLQDENDFLQDKVGQVEVLELEIRRLKERLNESEFFKLRVGELEEDLAKSQEESNQFEEKWQQAEAKLTRIAELETELSKWKSFSHELEQEKISIQTKLIESIDQETKLNSVNKKVEDEVRRLRDLIKTYEEQRDEEQASNSLIMTVADLKNLDDQKQQRQQVNKNPSMDIGTNTDELAFVQEVGQQTDTSDTADKSCETDPVNIITPVQHQVDDEYLKVLNDENANLKNEVKRQEARLNELVDSNKRIFDELDGNKKLISELRQDLACEKSLTQKLTTQLTSFTKQIKSLDKQYFPIHDAAAATTTITTQKQQPRPANQPRLVEEVSRNEQKAPVASEMVAKMQDKVLAGTDAADFTSPYNSPGGKKQKPLSPPHAESSQLESLVKRKEVAAKTSANLTVNNNNVANSIKIKSCLDSSDGETDENEPSFEGKLKRAPTPVKSYRSERDNKSSNFVRNSLPSKSVNFGHSKSSPYLDRIRASVTATAVTSSSNTSASSFNEHTTKNATVAPVNQQVVGGNNLHQPSSYVLNCMLSHHHSERCYAKVERPTCVQVSQPMIPNAIHTNPSAQQLNRQDRILLEQNQSHNQTHAHHAGASPSRQLNALIDPVPSEQYLMSVLQQRMFAQQQQSGLPSADQLSPEQIAELQRRHYIQHLHLHHLQLHQLHHLHYKCQQQPQQQQRQCSHNDLQPHKSDPSIVPVEPHANMVGSQFYAPSYDAIYANLATNNYMNKVSNGQSTEQRMQRQNGTRLVNNDSDLEKNGPRHQPQHQECKRISPQRVTPANTMYHHQGASAKLAQIDELSNNFESHKTVKKSIDQVGKQPQQQPRQSSETGVVQRSKYTMGGASSQQHEQRSSPILSSPTSSRTSSNVSPSSETSSSSSTSSTNSLSTSVPLTRSVLRHTATDLNRRQYSVERDLINSTPLTATLSRVGSCRGMSSSHHHHHLAGQLPGETTTPRDVSSVMRNPVQSQQPPMRTSKILSIGSQQQANSGATSNGTIDSNQLTLCKEIKRTSNQVDGIDNGLGRLTMKNMANIRLNDNLAFSSLRIPKKSSSGSNLNASLIAATASDGRSISTRVSSTSSSPDKARSLKTANSSSPVNNPTITGNNNNNGNSSVWYEYGCI